MFPVNISSVRVSASSVKFITHGNFTFTVYVPIYVVHMLYTTYMI